MLTPVRFDWAGKEHDDLEFRYVRYVDENGQEWNQGVVTGPDGYLSVSYFEQGSTVKIDTWFDTLVEGDDDEGDDDE